jgi:hypothetical protein
MARAIHKLTAREPRRMYVRLAAHAAAPISSKTQTAEIGAYLAAAIYLALSLVFWWPSRSLSKEFLGGSHDAISFIWLLNWWPFAIVRHLNPFVTHYVWFPHGENLTWATSVPTAALLGLPITTLISPVVAYNTLTLIGPAAGAWTAFLLARYLSRNWVASLLAGYIFGFSSYELGHILGHLNLDTIFLIPLAVLLCLKRFNGDIGRRSFVGYLAIVLLAQLGLSSELLATLCLFGALAWAVLLAFAPKHDRPKFTRLACDVALTAVPTIILASPFFYYLWKGMPDLPPQTFPPVDYSADILNYVAPTVITWIGHGWAASVADHFAGNAAENGAYLGLPLVLILALFFASQIRRAYVAALLVVFILFVAFSLGPQLHVGGRLTNYKMPWLIATEIPVLKIALPVRFTLYVSLIASISVALYVAAARNRLVAIGLAFLACLFIAPNVSAYWWAAWPSHPFFTAQNIRATLGDMPNVIIVPSGAAGLEMAYQLDAGMSFTQSVGYLTFPPYSEWQFTATNDVAVNQAGGGFATALSKLCATHGVDYLLITPQASSAIKGAIMGVGWPSRAQDGLTIVKVPH